MPSVKSKRSRRPRAIAARSGPLELQERDLDIIECIVELGGHLPADLIALQFWGHEASDPARRRLRKLLDARLLSATLVSSRRPNLYFVTRRGLDALVAERPTTSDLQLPSPMRSIGGLRHAELISMFRLYVASFTDSNIGTLRGWSGGRGQDARDLGLSAAHIAPDGIADLQLGSTEGVAFIEADAGTETRALRDKLGRYADYLKNRRSSELWILAAGGASRRASVAAWCVEAGLANKTRVFDEPYVKVRPAQRPVPRLATLWANGGPE